MLVQDERQESEMDGCQTTNAWFNRKKKSPATTGGTEPKQLHCPEAFAPIWMQELANSPHSSHLQAFFSLFVKAQGIAMGN